MAHCQNVARLSLFYRYYFGRCSSELTQLVPHPFSCGKCTCYSDRLHDFSVTIPRCYKDVYVNSFFPCTARLRNSLPIKCFPIKCIHKHTSSVSWICETTLTGYTYILFLKKQFVSQILKTNSVTHIFHFMFYDFRLMLLNLVVVSTINLQWSCVLAFSYPPLQTI